MQKQIDTNTTRSQYLILQNTLGTLAMLRLGIDVGTSSLGWALIKADPLGNFQKFIDSGAIIFPTGRNPKNGNPNAQNRRKNRSIRRNLDRSLKRRSRLLNELIRLNLMPQKKEDRTPYFSLCPFQLRAKALHQPLTGYELGRMLWSFYKRRGFLSNRKMGKASEDTNFKKEIQILQQRIENSSAQTVGEFFANRLRRGKPIKANGHNHGLRFNREMIMYELNLIKEKQAPFHHLTEEDWNILLETILFQRTLLPVQRGNCPLTGEDRAYRAYPYFQHFRIAQEINNLKYSFDGQPMQNLTHDHTWLLFEKLKITKSVKFSSLPKLFKLPYTDIRFNLETDNRDALQGDETAAIMANSQKGIGKKWHSLSLDQQQNLIDLILESEGEETLRHELLSLNLLSENEVEAVIQQGYTLRNGTASYSLSAIKTLLPILKDQGLSVYDAINEAGFEDVTRLSPEKEKKLPYYGKILTQHTTGGSSLNVQGNQTYQDILTYGKIPNPTVHIALNQIRKVVNEIIDLYGDLSSISIELARDLKQTKKQKKHDQKRQSENQKINDEISEDLQKIGAKATPPTKRKMRLWKEQMLDGKAICPYTGKVISIADLLSHNTEIEHILPFSRTLDNSSSNKVICFSADENSFKRNRSPAEAWSGEKYQQILARAKNLPARKYWRFLDGAMEKFEKGNGFTERHLNDTRYLSKVCKEYLSVVVPPNKVDVLTGQMTALLRGKWGLNQLISDEEGKNRNDHRHHIIDAAVIAVTSRSMLQRVARAAGESTQRRDRLIDKMPLPWESFRKDLADQLKKVIIHHKPKQKKPSLGSTIGSLHNDKAYGIISGPDAEGMFQLVETAEAVKSKDIPKVRDPYLREQLNKIWEEINILKIEAKDKETLLKQRAWTELKLRTPRLTLNLKKSSLAFIYDKNSSDQKIPYKAYKTDGNAYMDIWLLPNGNVKGETINRYTAHQQFNKKDQDKESPYHLPLIKDQYPTARKLMRLYVGDMIAVGPKDASNIYRISEISGSRFLAIHHNEGGNIKERKKNSNKGAADYYQPLSKSASLIIKDKVRKIHISPTGKLKDAGPFDERTKWKDKL